jgi:hypothetical protein
VIGDWQKAILNFRRSLESHEVLYGHTDKRTAIVGRLLHVSQPPPLPRCLPALLPALLP